MSTFFSDNREATAVATETAHELTVSDLHVHYGRVCALSEICFSTHCGRRVALLGRNGAGKSTLLKALAGITPISSGEINWSGEEITPVLRRYEIAYLPQRDEVDWDLPLTVQGMVEMGRYPHVGNWRRFGRSDRVAVREALSAMGMWGLRRRFIRELSGGQQQRVFIARALAQEAHVLLFDEPFGGLDRNAAELLADLLRELASSDHLVIASHHNLANVAEIFDDVLLLNRHLVGFGTTEEVCTEEKFAAAFAHDDESKNQ